MRKLTLEEKKERLKTISPKIEILSEENKKIKCRCLIDNHIWFTSWGNLISGQGCPKCSGNIPYTIDIIKDLLSAKYPNIEILSDKYTDSRTILKAKCKRDNHEWNTSWHVLYRDGCSECKKQIARDKKFIEIKEQIKITNPNIEILSTEYIASGNHLDCRCKIDGYEWKVNWHNLSQGKGCPKCGGSLKLTLETVVDKLAILNPDIEILSDKYVNNSTKLKLKCKIDHYIWEANWRSIQTGTGCPICGLRKNKLTLKEVKRRLKEINPNVKVIDTKYIGSKDKLLCKCLKDGNEWYVAWETLQSGKGCPECQKLNIDIIKERLYNSNPYIKILSTKYLGWDGKLECECLIDGYKWFVRWANLHNNRGCPVCEMSLGEREVKKALDNIGYNSHYLEYIFPDLIGDKGLPLRFDFAVFYNDKLTYLLEYDGEFHYKKYFEKQNFDRQQRYDKLKNEYCIKNNIPLIRIPYWEKDNISEILTDIFICKNAESKFIVNNNQIIGQSLSRPSLESNQ